MTTPCAPGSRAIKSEDWLAYSLPTDEDASQLFPPLDAQAAQEQVQEVVHHSPVLYGHDRHTWTQACIQESIAWMQGMSKPGVCQLLRRLKVVSKRGRAHVHSPDLQYDCKLQAVEAALQQARQSPDEVVFLYEDEFTSYLRPVVGNSYRARSEPGQKATGAGADKVRLAASVNAVTGRVVWRRRESFNVREMYRYFQYVQKQYPDAQVIYLALDNWPVHFHPYVLEHLAHMKQPNRIRFLSLPTYAPWTNPTEKYWRKLVREWLTFHPYAGDKKQFITQLDGWLTRHSGESQALLHELGLLPT